ncbi:NFACT RNA binding domain-containing protein [Vulcanisaeta distributa]|uniref:NFACT RNA binding domain-containing protein n=1 Tax=Vulcanisaeta distributa TaxID=164451 RepID=UPI0006D119CB|nr:NFACT RNA binding domain-containing protein [Vulcanisaeta distributa]
MIYGAREWFERFRWFVTSGGKFVIAGRDATQNEVIVRHYLRPWDIFVHADIPGGSVVIIRLAGPNDGFSDRDIQEAAQYAVSYSRAWAMGLSVLDAFYVRGGEQVTKRAPSGEYLGKGSFMIYGTRGGWIRNAELSLGVGVRIDSLNNSTLVRLITAPPSVIGSLSSYYVILRPGTKDRVNVSREIYDLFRGKVTGFTKVINLSHIVDVVPGPSIIEGVYEGNPRPWNELRDLAK